MAEKRPVLSVVRPATSAATFRLPAGRTIVGRALSCPVAIADQSLSREHFEIEWNATVCLLRDLDSRNGVQVNGRTVREAVLASGDEIAAGSVLFRFQLVEGRLSAKGDGAVDVAPEATLEPHPVFTSIASALSPAADPPEPGSLLAKLTAAFDPRPDCRLYAIVDGAQAVDLAFTARLMGHGVYTLFLGPIAEVAARVGPCLVALGDRSAFLEKWSDALGSHAGVLFESSADLTRLCAHLRHVFVATDEERQEYFFRFYDPRVLRAFLPTCRPDELDEFFGPIARWLAEDESGAAIAAYSIEAGHLRQEAIAVESTTRLG
jgi:hypothetical protein